MDTNIEKVNRRTVADQAFHIILKKISSGEWKIGEKIPSEIELAQDLGVSRTTLKMALQKLNTLGILETRVGEGSFVCEFSFNSLFSELLRCNLLTGNNSELNQFRVLVEYCVLRLAVLNPITEDEIDEYYKSNLSQFVTPETRNVLQMLFENEEDAKAAKAALDNGADFYQVAREKAGQTDEETNLEYVSEDMLIGDAGAKVFAAAKNEAVGPIQSELGWHIMKATDIKAGSKEDESKVKKQIAQTIANEKVYEVAYDIINGIEDKIGAGSSLEEIAEDMGVKTYRVKGMKENGEAASLPGSYASVLTGSDFIDAVFSYNKGEISQAVETDEGFVFVKVDNITDSHPQSIETALPKIKKMWRENEKSAITQELINDVMHDLESGDDISEAAGRYNLKVVTTEPLTRSQSFAGLSQPQMLELFNDAARTPKQIDRETQHIIAVAGKDAEPRKLSAEETDIIAGRLNLDLTQEAAAALIDSYGKDYDIRVKYRLLGLAD